LEKRIIIVKHNPICDKITFFFKEHDQIVEKAEFHGIYFDMSQEEI